MNFKQSEYLPYELRLLDSPMSAHAHIHIYVVLPQHTQRGINYFYGIYCLSSKTTLITLSVHIPTGFWSAFWKERVGPQGIYKLKCPQEFTETSSGLQSLTSNLTVFSFSDSISFLFD